jgi:hypothetical protein
MANTLAYKRVMGSEARVLRHDRGAEVIVHAVTKARISRAICWGIRANEICSCTCREASSWPAGPSRNAAPWHPADAR